MIEFTVKERIGRPPSEVFAYVADPAKLPTWQTNTVSVEQEGDGPVGLGTRLREVHSGPGGREVASLVEISEFEPDSVFALRMVESPLPVHGRIELRPDPDGGTELSFRVHGQPTGAMRLLQPVLRIGLRRQFEAHCANLKEVLEDE